MRKQLEKKVEDMMNQSALRLMIESINENPQTEEEMERIEERVMTKHVFQMYDIDRNGFVDKDEFKFMMRVLKGFRDADVPVIQFTDQLFKQYDKNKDGLLSYEEFRSYLLHQQ
jgi:Ca2+-binding EF-hand superfamily protein